MKKKAKIMNVIALYLPRNLLF